MASSALVAPHERVPGRGAVRRRADLADLAGQLQRVRSRCGSSTPDRSCRRRTSPGASARSSASCRTSCSATRPTSIPLVLVVIGWHYFWCRDDGRGVHEAAGRGPALRLHLVVPVAGVRHARRRRQGVPRRRLHRRSPRGASLAEYLNRTGSIILILTLLFAAIILSTQFSFGRLFSALSQMARERWAALRAAREQRRDEKAAGQAAPGSAQEAPREGSEGTRRSRRSGRRIRCPLRPSGRQGGSGQRRRRPPTFGAVVSMAIQDRGDDQRRRRRVEGRIVASRLPPPIKRPAAGDGREGADAAAAGAREGAGRAQEGGVHAAAQRAARRRQDRAEDRRAPVDGRRAAARGKVPRVLRRGHRRPDPSRSGRHDLRVQAGRRREVQQDHRAGRRPLPRDAGRVGHHRPHPRQVDRRDPDSEPQSRGRSRCASCSSPRPTSGRRRS